MVFKGRLRKDADSTMLLGSPLKGDADSTVACKGRLFKIADLGHPRKENADSVMVFGGRLFTTAESTVGFG